MYNWGVTRSLCYRKVGFFFLLVSQIMAFLCDCCPQNTDKCEGCLENNAFLFGCVFPDTFSELNETQIRVRMCTWFSCLIFYVVTFSFNVMLSALNKFFGPVSVNLVRLWSEPFSYSGLNVFITCDMNSF